MYEIRKKYQRRNDNYQNKDKDNAAIVEKNHPQRNAFRRKQYASGSTRDIFDAHKKDNDYEIDINIRIKSKDKYNNRNQERGYNNNYPTKANKYSEKSNYSWKVNNNNNDKEPVKWTRYNRNKEEDNLNEREDNIDNNNNKNNNDKNKIVGKTYNGRNKNFKSYSITKTTSIAYKRKTPSRDYTNYIYGKSEKEKEAPVQIKNNYDNIPNENNYEYRRERFNEKRSNEDLEAAEQKEREDKIEPKNRKHFASSAVNGSRRYNKNDNDVRNDIEEEIGQNLDNRNNNGKYGRYNKNDINNNKYNKYNKYEDKKDDDDYKNSKSRYHYKHYNRNDNENENENENDKFDKKKEDDDLNRIRMKYKVDEKNNNDKYNNKKDEDNDYHYNSKNKNKYEDQNNNKYGKKEDNDNDYKLKTNEKYSNKINNYKYSQNENNNENNYNNYKSKTNSQYDDKINNNKYGQREDDDNTNNKSGINNKYNNKYNNEYNNKYNNKYDNKYYKENNNDKYDEKIDDNINNDDLGQKNEKPYSRKYHNNFGIQNGNNDENDKENNNDNDINNNYEIKVNINSKKFDNDIINSNKSNNNNYDTNSNTNTNNNINHNNKKKYRYKSLNKDYINYGETIKEEDNEDLNLPSQRGRFNRLKNALIEIERFNAKKTLKGDMVEMFNKILKSNFDFKENIFFKNLIDTDLKVGDFDNVKKRPVSHTFKEIETIEILRNHQNADDLMKKYTNRARLIVDED